jgi:hypothetical protein
MSKLYMAMITHLASLLILQVKFTTTTTTYSKASKYTASRCTDLDNARF